MDYKFLHAQIHHKNYSLQVNVREITQKMNNRHFKFYYFTVQYEKSSQVKRISHSSEVKLISLAVAPVWFLMTYYLWWFHYLVLRFIPGGLSTPQWLYIKENHVRWPAHTALMHYNHTSTPSNKKWQSIWYPSRSLKLLQGEYFLKFSMLIKYYSSLWFSIPT